MSGLETRARVLLSLQRALLGMVTPDLRAVSVTWTANSADARFIYERDFEARRDGVAEIEAEVEAAMGTHFTASFHLEELEPQSPIKMSENETWVYMRAGR